MAAEQPRAAAKLQHSWGIEIRQMGGEPPGDIGLQPCLLFILVCLRAESRGDGRATTR